MPYLCKFGELSMSFFLTVLKDPQKYVIKNKIFKHAGSRRIQKKYISNISNIFQDGSN